MPRKPKPEIRTPPFADRTTWVSGWDDYRTLLAALGGKASPLVPCSVCGHLMHPSTRQPLGHTECLRRAGLNAHVSAPPETTGPHLGETAIGNVYAAISVSSDTDNRISDDRGREIYAAALDRLQAMAACDICGRPLGAGQRGRHTVCDPTGTQDAQRTTDGHQDGTGGHVRHWTEWPDDLNPPTDERNHT